MHWTVPAENRHSLQTSLFSSLSLLYTLFIPFAFRKLKPEYLHMQNGL